MLNRWKNKDKTAGPGSSSTLPGKGSAKKKRKTGREGGKPRVVPRTTNYYRVISLSGTRVVFAEKITSFVPFSESCLSAYACFEKLLLSQREALFTTATYPPPPILRVSTRVVYERRDNTRVVHLT